MKLYTESQQRALDEQGVVQISIRFRPRRLASIAFVLLLHAFFLYLLLKIGADIKNGRPISNPMVMIFDKVAQIKKGEPEAKKAEVKIKATKSNRAITPPTPPNQVAEAVNEPPPVKQEEPLPDMASMLNAARERRLKAEAAAAAENQAAQQGQRGLSSQEIAEANVRHSMERANGKDGNGGLFTILSKSVRTATFSFRGWDPRSKGARQVYEVDAGLGGNVELAIVKRMIEVIRTRFKNKAPWESDRLGRVIMISMLPEDNEETERFLMKEMFESEHARR